MVLLTAKHPAKQRSEAACLVFASAFLDFSPKSELVSKQINPLSFSIEFLSPQAIDAGTFIYIEERFRHLLKSENLEVFEMIPSVAKGFLLHHRQKFQAGTIAEKDPLVRLAKYGNFVMLYEEESLDIESLKDIKILHLETKEATFPGRRALYKVTFQVTFSDDEASLKDKVNTLKEAQKNSYLTLGLKHHYFMPSHLDDEELTILPEGIKLIQKIQSHISTCFQQEGFQEVMTPSSDLEELLECHQELHASTPIKKSFEFRLIPQDEEPIKSFLFKMPLAHLHIALISCKLSDLSKELIYSLKFLEETIKISPLFATWTLSEATSKNKEVYKLVKEGLDRDIEEDVLSDCEEDAVRLTLVVEDSFKRKWPLMWLLMKKVNEEALIYLSCGSLEANLAIWIERSAFASS